MNLSLSHSVRLEDVRLSLEGAAGRVDILRGVDLTIKAGEALGVVGPSGSGKTSMLMVIAGLERASGGRVVVADQDITRLGEDDLALFRRRHVGFVFQNFHLVPTMTALENVALPLEFAGIPDALDRAAAQLAAVNLGHRVGHYPSQLSGGEQQRVALARAFVSEPDILLADEPTGNLDVHTGEAVIEVLFDLHARKGTTLVLVTHSLALADRCSRVVRMVDGRIERAEPAAAPRAAEGRR